MTGSSLRDLRRLARFCGIKLDFWDIHGNLQTASEASMLGVLKALGHGLHSSADAAAALALLRAARWRAAIAPVTVVWQGEKKSLRLRLPEPATQLTLRLAIELEDGGKIEKLARGLDLLARPARGIGAEKFAVCEWPLPANLPAGYHRINLEYAGAGHRAHLLVAPIRAYASVSNFEFRDSGFPRSGWGVFLPLYALRMKDGMGAADWKDFQRLTDWVDSLGGEVAATLPMLAGFLGNGPRGDESGPFEYSPYSPASRLFLNEFYIDLAAVPELDRCIEARRLLDSDEFHLARAELNAAPLVDYRRQMSLKRRVLELLAQSFFQDGDPARKTGFDAFMRDFPDAGDYARFRAVTERRAASWWTWPDPQKSGTLAAEDADPRAERYHLYVQWVAFDQMKSLAERARAAGRGLYLDMPLGVNSDGYDVWRNRAVFALQASGGAPPDGFFSKGQNWGFPPIHPEASRAGGHRYFAAVVRRLMRMAGVLRIDHVMSLHRLYWIPAGMAATGGLYVRYPAEELYAILSIESHRHQCEVVGENLGTVPPTVNLAMGRHGVRGMHVMQFGVSGDPRHAIQLPAADTVASVNTHDTATFSGWWSEADLDLQLEMGLIDEHQRRREGEGRGHVRSAIQTFLRNRGLLHEDNKVVAVQGACLKYLATSDSDLLLINLEDLWGEVLPQNVPGTGPAERPNWRRRAAIPFEAWTIDAELIKLLREVNELRRRQQ